MSNADLRFIGLPGINCSDIAIKIAVRDHFRNAFKCCLQNSGHFVLVTFVSSADNRSPSYLLMILSTSAPFNPSITDKHSYPLGALLLMQTCYIYSRYTRLGLVISFDIYLLYATDATWIFTERKTITAYIIVLRCSSSGLWSVNWDKTNATPQT